MEGHGALDRKEQVEELCVERHALSLMRLKEIQTEQAVSEPFGTYFRKIARFLLQMEEVRLSVQSKDLGCFDLEALAAHNQRLYADILPGQYEQSYANPAYAARVFPEGHGSFLSFLYSELRGEIVYAYENRLEYMTILNELFLQVYGCFVQGEPTPEEIRQIGYWYGADYSALFLEDRIREQLYPAYNSVVAWILQADLQDVRYLYGFGEYITENEIKTARHLAALPPGTIQKMADVYTQGYYRGFVNTGKDLSKKSAVNIQYHLGFERVVRQAIYNFREMGLQPVICRTPVSLLTRQNGRKGGGYEGAPPNLQYTYDHRFDEALFLDKRYMERRLDALRTIYEKHQAQAAEMAGPAVMETFGEKPFSPCVKKEAPVYSQEQETLARTYDSKSGRIVNQYIRGDERSYTIIAYPLPEIGESYEEIFAQVIRINTLDAKLYERVQQTLIDALDQGEYVQVTGRRGNKTDMKVRLHSLEDSSRQTIFENCVADVNIPVGEVFTSPVLQGTNGTLHVGKVYLNGLQYKDLEFTFQDGRTVEYTCQNFPTEEENQKYIREAILHNHESLPLGEFAIGTNTVAYMLGKKYGIEEKLPILIAEKTGPHFALGDTCYSWSEDVSVFNPNGKEIIARDNEISIQRNEDISKAYFYCHTDITIPYEELGEIVVVTKEGKRIPLLSNGRFVLPGTEWLNEPLDQEEV